MYKRVLNFGLFIIVAFLASCTVETSDGDLAEEIDGIYIITSTESSSSAYQGTVGDTILVTKVDETNVDISIDFSNILLPDLDLEMVIVSETSTDDYDLNREFSNATVIGFSNDSEIRIRLDYTDGDFVDIMGMK